MATVTGLGGVFLRAHDPEALYAWYERHLGLVRGTGAFAFPAPTRPAQVTFALFAQDDALCPETQHAMLNLQVDDLDGLLARLSAEGVMVDPNRESYAFGRFGWCTDPEGHRIELWEPAQED